MKILGVDENAHLGQPEQEIWNDSLRRARRLPPIPYILPLLRSARLCTDQNLGILLHGRVLINKNELVLTANEPMQQAEFPILYKIPIPKLTSGPAVALLRARHQGRSVPFSYSPGQLPRSTVSARDYFHIRDSRSTRRRWSRPSISPPPRHLLPKRYNHY